MKSKPRAIRSYVTYNKFGLFRAWAFLLARRIAFLLMLISGSSASAYAQDIATPATITPIEASTPYTADELMAKILKVAALDEDKLTRENVENIFGIRFPESKAMANGEKDITKVTLQGQQLNTLLIFHQGVGRDAEFTLFFEYDHDPAEGYAGREYESRLETLCIPRDKFVAALEQQGWKHFMYTALNEYGTWFVRGATGAINFAARLGKHECLRGIFISRGERFNQTLRLQKIK